MLRLPPDPAGIESDSSTTSLGPVFKRKRRRLRRRNRRLRKHQERLLNRRRRKARLRERSLSNEIDVEVVDESRDGNEVSESDSAIGMGYATAAATLLYDFDGATDTCCSLCSCLDSREDEPDNDDSFDDIDPDLGPCCRCLHACNCCGFSLCRCVSISLRLIPICLIVFTVVLTILLGYAYHESEEESLSGFIDALTSKLADKIDPAMRLWRLEAVDGVLETLWKRINEDPYLLALRFRFLELKEVVKSLVGKSSKGGPNGVHDNILEFLKIPPSHNLTAKHPVVIVPGHLTSHLEAWRSRKGCNIGFKDRMWGGLEMFRTFFRSSRCWFDHIRLDPETGMDPEGIRVRAKSEAIDYFLPVFWVWARIVEALAAIGYDQANTKVAEYDWRMGAPQLEARDLYFSRLKNHIEMQHRLHGERVVVISHSLGGTLWFNFMQWVESKIGGKERPLLGLFGKRWVEKHVHAIVAIATPFLGIPKAASALLSGEMRETMELFFLDPFLPQKERVRIMRTWLSFMEMLPKGSPEVWKIPLYHRVGEDPITIANLHAFMKNATDPYTTAHLETYFLGSLDDPSISKDDPRYWSNPFACQLPYAPSTTYYTIAGIGLPTEQSYHIVRDSEDPQVPWVFDYTGARALTGPIASFDPWGDQTCTYDSLTYAPRFLWRTKKYNPGNMKIVLREYLHDPNDNDLFDFRGGGGSAQHIDVLGHSDVMRDLLEIVSGAQLGDSFVAKGTMESSSSVGGSVAASTAANVAGGGGSVSSIQGGGGKGKSGGGGGLGALDGEGMKNANNAAGQQQKRDSVGCGTGSEVCTP